MLDVLEGFEYAFDWISLIESHHATDFLFNYGIIDRYWLALCKFQLEQTKSIFTKLLFKDDNIFPGLVRNKYLWNALMALKESITLFDINIGLKDVSRISNKLFKKPCGWHFCAS